MVGKGKGKKEKGERRESENERETGRILSIKYSYICEQCNATSGVALFTDAT